MVPFHVMVSILTSAFINLEQWQPLTKATPSQGTWAVVCYRLCPLSPWSVPAVCLFQKRIFRDKCNGILRSKSTSCHPANNVKALSETRYVPGMIVPFDMPHLTWSLESTPYFSPSTSFQSLHLWLAFSCSYYSPLSLTVTPSLFHYRLKTYLFHKSFLRKATIDSVLVPGLTPWVHDRTISFFWASRFGVFSF